MRNQAIVIDEVGYKKLLKSFEIALISKKLITPEMRVALNLLSNSCTSRHEHIQFWGKYYCLFPPKWRPPLRLEYTFDLTYLTNDAKAAYYEQAPQLQHYFDRIAFLQKEREQKAKYNLTHKTEDDFYESELQKY